MALLCRTRAHVLCLNMLIGVSATIPTLHIGFQNRTTRSLLCDVHDHSSSQISLSRESGNDISSWWERCLEVLNNNYKYNQCKEMVTICVSHPGCCLCFAPILCLLAIMFTCADHQTTQGCNYTEHLNNYLILKLRDIIEETISKDILTHNSQTQERLTSNLPN